MKLVSIVVLVISMVFISSLFQATMAQPATRPPGAPSVCDKKCGVRCNKAKNNATCLKYCGMCCEKCNSCVPSGFIGNKDECPCYRDMRNSKDQPKCP